MNDPFDVVIVGASPAGVFAALALSRRSELRIVMFDKGPDIDRRHGPAREPRGRCQHCEPCDIMAGWGGAGAFSDGKLTLSPAVGGRLTEILGVERVAELMRRVDETYVRFGARGPIYGTRTDEVGDLEKRAALDAQAHVSLGRHPHAPQRHTRRSQPGPALSVHGHHPGDAARAG